GSPPRARRAAPPAGRSLSPVSPSSSRRALAEHERAPIDLAAGRTGRLRDGGDSVLERLRAQRLAQQRVDLLGRSLGRRGVARRAASFAGKNPSKKKRSVGSPATASAASTADGPGTAVTATPASCAARTSL